MSSVKTRICIGLSKVLLALKPFRSFPGTLILDKTGSQGVVILLVNADYASEFQFQASSELDFSLDYCRMHYLCKCQNYDFSRVIWQSLPVTGASVHWVGAICFCGRTGGWVGGPGGLGGGGRVQSEGGCLSKESHDCRKTIQNTQQRG